MTLNINLTPQLETMVRDKVALGMYSSASEVVREALRLMTEQDQLRAIKLENLRRDIQEGLDSGPSTPWNLDEFLADVRRQKAEEDALDAKKK